MKIQYTPNLKSLSRQLRSQSTLGEVLLWSEIKGRKLGYQFMRQKPILSFVVDFYCSPLKLAIEIDGASHDAKTEADIQRQQKLEQLGITFLRFTEQDVTKNADGVVRVIADWISLNKGSTAF